MRSMLKVVKVEVRYGGIPIIHDVSLEVKQGELVAWEGGISKHHQK